MTAFASAVFVSAFLLFQVQPVIAKFILPWYGGSPAVWTTCLLFFQVALLAGYTYAHLLAQNVSIRRQPLIHLGLLFVSFVLLPIAPSSESVSPGEQQPTYEILILLATTVGIPFIIISASAPLLQHWFANAHPGRSPFRLYALSNAGSLLALLSYPVLIEPMLDLDAQTGAWSIGYVVFAILCAICALPLLRGSVAPAHESADVPEPNGVVSGTDKLLWVLLAACGSTVLLATTNQMCQDVAVVPFLWVLPLSLYLITFIICFENDRWYQRAIWIPFLLLSVGALVFLLHQDYAGGEMPLVYQIAIYSLAMFGCCMVCHGELVRRRSSIGNLTTFYLYVALGGALGGLFVNLVAPLIFDGFWELHVSLVLTGVLAGSCIYFDRSGIVSNRQRRSFAVVWTPIVVVLAVSLLQHIQRQHVDSVLNTRSFYGVLHVYEYDRGEPKHNRSFYHGRIQHGSQYLGPNMEFRPSIYYAENSGVALAFTQHPKRTWVPGQSKPLKIGVLGLGAGAVSVHATDIDSIRFYELNPQVEDIAREYFTYLDHGARQDVVLGDARLSLERELHETGPQGYDIMIIDAFSGDSVPMHLLTAEAFDLYVKHLAPGGVLALNITNFHLDLSDVVRQQADRLEMPALFYVMDETRFYEYTNNWVLMTKNEGFLGRRRVRLGQSEWPRENPRPIFWTDKFSNLFEVIYW